MYFYTDDWGLEAVYHESWYRDSELNFLEVRDTYLRIVQYFLQTY